MSPTPELDAARLVAADDLLSGTFDGETVILNLQSGVYYGLDEVGGTAWSLLKAPVTLNDIRDALVAAYDVAAEQCETDLRRLVQDLLKHGLVRLADADVA